MSSVLCSQGMVLATAMAAVSGTVILLAFRLQKPPKAPLRPCLSSEGKKLKNKSKKKRVKFAEDVVDPIRDGDEFRRQHGIPIFAPNNSSSSSSSSKFSKTGSGSVQRKNRGMPENRAALYNGILRDRVIQRLAYSY